MKKLSEFIQWNHQTLEKVNDENGRSQIISLANKLESLESEILGYADARIDIMPSGNIFIDSFPEGLASKIRALLV